MESKDGGDAMSGVLRIHFARVLTPHHQGAWAEAHAIALLRNAQSEIEIELEPTVQVAGESESLTSPSA
jgi:hypothetical protein